MSSYKTVPKQPGSGGKQPSMNPEVGGKTGASGDKQQKTMNPGVGQGSGQFNTDAAAAAWKKLGKK